MTDSIEIVFGADGILSRELEGYAPRAAQVEMARAVDEAILCDRRIAVEAPTGTGKSLAYLVPAIAWAAEHGRKVIVATANIALQEQVIEKDLPLLSRILPWEFTFALAKGRSNYACLREAAEIEDVEAWQQDEVEAVYEWLGKTRTGDWSEVHWDLAPQVRRLFVIDHDECPGAKKCSFGERCWAEAARKKVRDADVVVTNYHLLMAHLALQARIGKSSLLPELDVVVLDEAHRAADIARDFFGLRVTEHGARRLARHLQAGSRGNAEFKTEIVARAGDMFSALGQLAGEHRPRLRTRLPVNRQVERLGESLGKLAAEYDRVSVANDEPESGGEWSFRAQRCRDYVATVATLVRGDLDDGLVRFIGTTGKSVTLEGKPVDVGPYLAESLFGRARCTVLTSATLAVAGGFGHFARDAGLADYDALAVESPFDFSAQCELVVCADAPDPNTAEFTGYVCRKVEECARAAGGRMLGLFTSYRHIDACHEHLERMKLPFRLMRQGHGERTRLIEEFRRDVTSVLLGTDSFWAGVDVQGEALSVVVIDKLPFPNLNDPVLSALSERDPRKSFMRDSLPRAVIQLKQGFGRLIRTSSDVGVVVICDPRVRTKRYGSQFLASLPRGVPVSEDATAAIERKLGRQPRQRDIFGGDVAHAAR